MFSTVAFVLDIMSFIFGNRRVRRRSSDLFSVVSQPSSGSRGSSRRGKSESSPNRSQHQVFHVMPEDALLSARGVRFREIVTTSATTTTIKGSPRWYSPCTSPDLAYCGPLVTFSFLLPAKGEKLSYTQQQNQLKSAFEDSPLFREGLLLDTREKGVLFPVVHMSNKAEITKVEEAKLPSGLLLHQGLYQEVRNIVPETELPKVAPEHQEQRHIGYILLGFKSLDRNFSQVMVDSWKDWTGARYIYMYLPDDLGLRRITFYHRQQPDDLDLFMYLVLVECHGVTSREQQVRLLDFAQRMRLERMTGYISVYTGKRHGDSISMSPPLTETATMNSDILDSFLTNTIVPRNTRV